MNEKKDPSEPAKKSPPAGKIPYATPELIVHGTLVELTKALTQGADDGVIGTAP